MRITSLFLSMLLAVPVSLYPAPKEHPSKKQQTCDSCSLGDFQGKLSLTVVSTAINNLNRVRTGSVNNTLTSSDVRGAAISLKTMFDHFNEIGLSKALEDSIPARKDIKGTAFGITDAVIFQKKMAAQGVPITTSQALSVLQVSPDSRQKALDDFARTGMSGIQRTIMHRLHLLDNKILAKANERNPSFKLAKFPPQLDTPFWGLYDLEDPDDAGLLGGGGGPPPPAPVPPCSLYNEMSEIMGACCLLGGEATPCCEISAILLIEVALCQITDGGMLGPTPDPVPQQ